ncbi:CD63 antigen [Cryptotermes secundus]|uniref:Tetraspanin n=1 Tax=Cryptotermes secundus TaxID=105785 RepID=A0A2J7QZL2_9NEOP|nr:CD63 antigen [Cryptotermes secundus]PNF34005.1 CD63 antigen [Cryptotermes secundus]
MVSGGMACVKYLLFVFNLVFAISGIAILAVGAIIQNFYSNYTDFLHGKFFVGPVLLIVVGVIVFVVAFFGCCGAVKENHCMIMTFAGLLLVVFGLELAGGITGYVLRDDVGDMLQNTVNSSMSKYSYNKEITKTWDIMQHDLHCCGTEGPGDWKNVFKNNTLPETCCPSVDPCEMDSKDHYYKDGCLSILQNEIKHYALLLGGVGIGLACVQLIGVVFACCLARSIRKEYETV